MRKNILLIGGAGYVGTELSKILVKNNYDVTVYDLFIYGQTLPLNQNNLNKKAKISNNSFKVKSIWLPNANLKEFEIINEGLKSCSLEPDILFLAALSLNLSIF